MPAITEAQNAPGGPPAAPAGTPSGLTASTSIVTPMNVFVISNATVLRALELAGKRLVGNQHRSEFTCPPYELHTRLTVRDEAHARKVLANAWDHLPLLVEQVDPTLDTQALREALDQYCTALLTHKRPHHVLLLREYLTRAGFLHEQE